MNGAPFNEKQHMLEGEDCFELQMIRKRRDLKGMISLGLDFTFVTLCNLRTVKWQRQAPWYRSIEDGLCWFGYC